MAGAIIALFTAGIFGCGPEPISTYTVSKLQPTAVEPPQKPAPRRILAAIARLPEITWTVKVMGEPPAIEAMKSQWEPFLRSLKFSPGAPPTFELPEGWRISQQTSQFRDLVLEVGTATPPLEVIFTRMPAEFDLAANVNRWRAGQLGLQPIAEDELPNHLRELSAGQVKLLLFDAEGQAAGSGMSGMAPPSTGVSAVPATSTTAAATVKTSADPTPAPVKPIRFDPPEGWQTGQTNSMVTGKFTKTAGVESIELSVLPLKSDSPWPETVAIWSGGLGLDALSAEEIDRRTESIEIDGRPARLIDLQSEDGRSATRIASVVVEADNWIFKLSGSQSLLQQETETWNKFLESVRFEQPGAGS